MIGGVILGELIRGHGLLITLEAFPVAWPGIRRHQSTRTVRRGFSLPPWFHGRRWCHPPLEASRKLSRIIHQQIVINNALASGETYPRRYLSLEGQPCPVARTHRHDIPVPQPAERQHYPSLPSGFPMIPSILRSPERRPEKISRIRVRSQHSHRIHPSPIPALPRPNPPKHSPVQPMIPPALMPKRKVTPSCPIK